MRVPTCAHTRSSSTSIKHLTTHPMSPPLWLHCFSTQSKFKPHWIVSISLYLSCSVLPQGLWTCSSLSLESYPLFTWLPSTHASTWVQPSLSSPTISILPARHSYYSIYLLFEVFIIVKIFHLCVQFLLNLSWADRVCRKEKTIAV